MARGKPKSLTSAAASKLSTADRPQLLESLETYRNYRNELLRRQIIDGQRIDLLATEILGYSVQPFHFAMQRYQFLHPHSLQLAFRGAGKTTTCTVTKIVHLLASDRNLRILIASKTKRNAETFLKEVKAHLETNKKLIELFGHFYDPYKVSKWDNTEIEVLGRTQISKEASVTCVGVDSAVVSRHYDVIICDDLVDEENARTKAMREKTRVWYYQTLDPTLEPPDPSVPYRGQRHVLGTRYHYDDLYGHLIDNELKDHHQIIPALNEDGESPWPSKYPPEWFLEKKSNAGLIIFNCHSDDTEFLTDQGWRKFDDVSDAEKLMTLNLVSGELEFQTPTERIAQQFNGNMLHLKNRGVDALVTPNHRMVARPQHAYLDEGQWQIVPASELCSVSSSRTNRVCLPCSGMWKGDDAELFLIPSGDPKRKSHVDHSEVLVDMDTFLRFIGFFVSEGATSATVRGAISFSQNVGHTADEIIATIEDLGFTTNINSYVSDNGQESVIVSFSHIGLWDWLRKNCGVDSHSKRIPRFVFALSQRQLRLVLDATVDGDGSRNPRGSDGSFWYTTTSQQLDSDLCELALRCGMSWYSRMREPTNPNHARQWAAYCFKAENRGLNPRAQMRHVPYNGRVVCFTVPNHTLVTRRNGRVLISGNSQYICNCDAMKGEVFRYDDCNQLRSDEWPAESTLKVFMGVDLAIKESESADQFAIVVIGVDGKIGSGTEKYYVLYFYAGHLRFSDQTSKIIKVYKEWKPISCLVEANAYQLAQVQELKRVEPDMRVRPHITDKDKMTRAWKLSPLFESGRMFFRKDVQGTLIDQLVLFPNHRYKDLFDALDLAVMAAKRRRKKRPDRHEPRLI